MSLHISPFWLSWPLLGVLSAIVDPSCGPLGPPWGHPWITMELIGSLFKSSWLMLDLLGTPWSSPDPLLAHPGLHWTFQDSICTPQSSCWAHSDTILGQTWCSKVQVLSPKVHVELIWRPCWDKPGACWTKQPLKTLQSSTEPFHPELIPSKQKTPPPQSKPTNKNKQNSNNNTNKDNINTKRKTTPPPQQHCNTLYPLHTQKTAHSLWFRCRSFDP